MTQTFRLRRFTLTLAVLASFPPAVPAYPMHSDAQGDPATTLDTVQVRAGSGPEVWRFTKGGTTVMVISSLQPLPLDLTSSNPAIANRISVASAVLGPEGVVIGEGIGILRGLTLWPSIRNTKYLRDGRSVTDVLTPTEAARWNELKQRYLPRERRIDALLPMYAAWKLHEAALSAHGLGSRGSVSKLISDAAHARRVPVIDARYRLSIGNPKRAVAGFQVPADQDLNCFRRTMADLTPWLDAAPAIADAWFEGHTAEAGSLLSSAPRPARCWSQLTNEAIARGEGVDLDAATAASWRQALREASDVYPVILTALPLEDLLAGRGRVADLRKMGFLPVTEDDDPPPHGQQTHTPKAPPQANGNALRP